MDPGPEHWREAHGISYPWPIPRNAKPRSEPYFHNESIRLRHDFGIFGRFAIPSSSRIEKSLFTVLNQPSCTVLQVKANCTQRLRLLRHLRYTVYSIEHSRHCSVNSTLLGGARLKC
jgi:hypothetical protein